MSMVPMLPPALLRRRWCDRCDEEDAAADPADDL
jgi:hypothetical protein